MCLYIFFIHVFCSLDTLGNKTYYILVTVDKCLNLSSEAENGLFVLCLKETQLGINMFQLSLFYVT